MSNDDYYDREPQKHIDGSLIFKTEADAKNEQCVAELCKYAWGVEVKPFAKLAALDWFAERNGRVVGVLELKTRSHSTTSKPTVFLSVRKWLALILGSVGLNCPAIFVVKFTDSVRWIAIQDVDPRKILIGGADVERLRHQKGAGDVEPLILVPVASMKVLTELAAGNAGATGESSIVSG